MGRLESEALFHLEFSCLFPHPLFLLLNNKYHVAFNFFLLPKRKCTRQGELKEYKVVSV